MRKTFLVSLLLAMIANLAGAQTYVNLVDTGDLFMIPGALTKDGEAVLYLYDWEDRISILDENFQVSEKFLIPDIDDLISFTIISGEIGGYDSGGFFEDDNFLAKDIFAPGYNYLCLAADRKSLEAYNADNKKVSTLKFPGGYYISDDYYDDYYSVAFLILGNKKYLMAEGLVQEGKEEEWYNRDYTAIFSLNDTGSDVALVSVLPTAKVSPRSPRKGEKVCVTIDDEFVGKNCMVQVVSASGQKVFDSKIPAGQNQIDINTSRFSKGIYAVTVIADGISKEATKIIIR